MLCGESSPNRNYRRTLKRYAKREIISPLPLQCDTFITSLGLCEAVLPGQYYLCWLGRSNNTHPLVKKVALQRRLTKQMICIAAFSQKGFLEMP